MWQASEGISLAAVAILLLMTFGMGGTGTSDNAHEFIHRPFVWAYWLVGSLAAGRLFSILAARRPQLWTRGRSRQRYRLNTGSSVLWLGVTAWQRIGR